MLGTRPRVARCLLICVVGARGTRPYFYVEGWLTACGLHAIPLEPVIQYGSIPTGRPAYGGTSVGYQCIPIFIDLCCRGVLRFTQDRDVARARISVWHGHLARVLLRR